MKDNYLDKYINSLLKDEGFTSNLHKIYDESLIEEIIRYSEKLEREERIKKLNKNLNDTRIS